MKTSAFPIQQFLAVLFISAMLSTHAFSAARIARIPSSVTQTYENGDFATFVCPFGTRASDAPACRLIIKEGRRKVVARLDPMEHGYQFVFQEFAIFGHIADNDLTLFVALDCIDADLNLISTDARSNAACRLVYSLRDGRLVAESTEITSELDGRPVFTRRLLPDRQE